MRGILLGLAACAAASVWPTVASADNKEFSQAIAATLRDSGRLADYSIGVTTKDDVVYLKGRVANEEQLATAMQMASNMPGVSKVVNELEVKPSSKSAAKNVGQGLSNVRKTIFPDPSLPAESPRGSKSTAKRSSKKGSSLAKKPSASTESAYAVQQVSQNVPRSFAPGEMNEAMQAPMMQGPGMPGPGLQGPGMQPPMMQAPARLAMAPLAAAGAAAGAAMGQCPPGEGGPIGMGPNGMVGGPGGGGPMPMSVPAVGGGVAPARYDQPYMPNYAWPSYAAYPNYAQVAYPRQYSPTAWPYIGPFYPYPQVPLGWRKVMLEWDDGWWMLNFKQ